MDLAILIITLALTEFIANKRGPKTGQVKWADLDTLLQTMASQHAHKAISRSYVLIAKENPSSILGFLTLTSCEIRSDALPSQFVKKYPSKIPGAKIGRLAVSREKQQQGLGELLMLFAMNQVLIVHKTLGLTEMIVDAKNEQAQQYYKQYGFIPLPEAPLTLFLPIKSIL
ncbi:MAG: GNAT family N-acetyltransferase, partial [Deltaproteobacteria bacterium]|nr:GNAT family N-acetyltransferase [Deltaproteobacteria bacterium]